MKEELKNYLQHALSWENPLFFAFLIAGFLALALYIFYFHIFLPNKKKAIEAELKSTKLLSEKFKALALQYQERLEEEKERLGRELHDSIGQNLLLIRMQINNPASTKEPTLQVIDSTLHDLKEIIFELKPRALEELGLPAALLELCKHIKENSQYCGEVSVTGNVVKLGGDKEIYLYRTVQECINNVIKHSGVTEFNIQMFYNEHVLKIVVLDEGKGMNVEEVKNSDGNGLFNIEQRMNHIGGSLKITSAPNEGTVMLMEIPYD
jgi:signal transduction histidine kinase